MLGLTRWSPFSTAFQLHREIDDLFSRFFGDLWSRPQGSPGVAWWPAVEAYTQDGQYCVRVALPGVDPKDVEVSVTEGYLTIKGERKAASDRQEGATFLREFAYGAFERTIELPDGVDPAKVTARYQNGMLEITMPAPLSVAPRKVEIQVEGPAPSAKAIKAA